MVCTITPQQTAQYGQFDRVSVVFEVFKERAWATRGRISSPSAIAPLPPAIKRMKSRRDACIPADSSWEINLPLRRDFLRSCVSLITAERELIGNWQFCQFKSKVLLLAMLAEVRVSRTHR